MQQNNYHCLKEASKSYWLASVDHTGYPALENDIKVDVAIVGGGIAGLSCAYRLTKEGVKTAVIEADKIFFGTTGHTTAKITSQHELIYDKTKNNIGPEMAQQYANANEAAIKTIENTISELKIQCDFEHQSAYVYTQKDENIQKINNEVKTAIELGIKATYVEKIPFNIPIKAAVRFDNQAQFHPGKYLLALAKQITDKGNHIFEHSKVVDMEEKGAYILTTDRGIKVTAEKVIIASHYPFFNKAGLYFARISAERSYIVAVKAEEKYPGGMYINAEDPSRSLRRQSDQNGELILVGGERHKTGQSEDTIRHYEALIDFSNQLFAVKSIPFHWSAQDCMTLDGIPYVGHYTSDTPNLYIATGFGKWGMTNSTVSAAILTDLIVRGESPWSDVYNPSRFTITASMKNLLVENANVAANLVQGKLSLQHDDVEISSGQGKVINVDGHRAGAYRDAKGELHIVDTTCTHMGCELNWNMAEKSWDCPCHGSRFSVDGEVIEGPAIRPLNVGKSVNTIEKLVKDEF